MSSNRVKRLLKKIEKFRGKNKRRRISAGSDDECPGTSNVWTPKLLGDYSSSNIYNSTARSQPAELFRKDLISAMKLPDSEPLTPDDYWFISDQWKQEWEKGVQVPVNPDALPEALVRSKKKDKVSEFKLPKNLIRLTQNENFSSEIHHLSNVKSLAENVCRYDLDENDANWLTTINRLFSQQGLPTIKEELMEKLIQEFELQCYDNTQEIIQAETGLGIEFDEDVICDVCRSPDSEEGNEMVFCDSCDICVHQACYGITEIPTGSWICRGCDSGLKPTCVLCPNKGGAIKCTRTGQQWVHVSCALWIPEVSIGCVEKMEPITKLANIPQSRWTLLCCVCKEKMGACIQCSVKACKTAYHVTCGFRGGLEMKAVVVNDEHDEDGVKLRSYCPKHSKNKRKGGDENDSDDDCGDNVDEKKDEKNSRVQKLQHIENNFFKHVELNIVANNLGANREVVGYVYYYWKLKRKAAFNKPLLALRPGHNDDLDQDDDMFARMKMFVQIRQDLERVRNLCYMVTRREKLSRTWCNLREEIFRKQISVLTDSTLNLPDEEKRSVIHSCHGSSVYDRLCAFKGCSCQAKNEQLERKQFDELESERGKRNNSNARQPNPYAKTYIMNRSCRISRRQGDRSADDNADSSDFVKENISDGDTRLQESLIKPSFKFAESETDLALNDRVSNSEKINNPDLEPGNGYPFRATRTRQRNLSALKSEKVVCVNGASNLIDAVKDGYSDNFKREDSESNKDGEKREEESTENLSGRGKTRKSKQKPKLSKGHLKELASKNNSAEDVSQCRVKQRQESEKIHESLFATSQKGKLVGYRIPKKSRIEAKSEMEFIGNGMKPETTVSPTASSSQEILPQASPPKDPRLSSPNFISQNHPPTSPFKVTSPQPIINSPRSPRNSAPQVIYPANTYPPRLVMKLRKDRNFPESQQQWMRANDSTANINVYDFSCEKNESSSMQGCANNCTGNQEQSSSLYEYPKSQCFSVAVSQRPEIKSTEKRTNFNNYSDARSTRTNVVNSVVIQSTYY